MTTAKTNTILPFSASSKFVRNQSSPLACELILESEKNERDGIVSLIERTALMKKGAGLIKAVIILDKATNQRFLDNCYHKTAEDAEKYLREYEKIGGRSREDWTIVKCNYYGCVDELSYKKIEEVKYKKGKYKVPSLDACEVNFWRVALVDMESPLFTSRDFSNRHEAVSYFEEAVNYFKEQQIKYNMRLIQGCRILLDING